MVRKLIITLAAAAALAAAGAAPALAHTAAHANRAVLMQPSCGSDYYIFNGESYYLQDNGHANKVTVAGGSCWYFVDQGGGWDEIVNASDGLCVEKGADPDNHTWMESCNGSTSEQFKAFSVTGSLYRLENRHSGTYLQSEGTGSGQFVIVGGVRDLYDLWNWA